MTRKTFPVIQRVFSGLLISMLFTGLALAAVSDADFRELCAKGSFESINDAMKAGAIVNSKDENGETPLMRAARLNSPEVIAVLVKAEAEVNARNQEGDTALLIAAQNNFHPEVLTELVQAGAQINAKNQDGNTPLILAAEISTPEVVTTLLQFGAEHAKAGDRKNYDHRELIFPWGWRNPSCFKLIPANFI